MSKMIFIKEIISIAKEPRLCPTCQKEDKLEKNLIREERSCGKTILCTRCEALIVYNKVCNVNWYQQSISDVKPL